MTAYNDLSPLLSAALSVDVMDASGSSGNDANHAKDIHLHKVSCMRGPADNATAGTLEPAG